MENIGGKLLFQLRDNKYGIPNPNKWGLFGGGMEQGETPVQAVRREVKEELGIDIKPSNLRLLFKKESNSSKRYVFYYKLQKEQESFRLGEGQKYQFLSLREIILKRNVVPSLRLFMIMYPLFKFKMCKLGGVLRHV